MTSFEDIDVLIVGAGISGLSAARTLINSNTKVVLLDKGFRVGGRVASRSIGNRRVDHGAQFFTARSDEFKDLVCQATEQRYVREWVDVLEDVSHPRYCGTKGINSFPQFLSKGLDARTGKKVARIQTIDNSWIVHTTQGERYCAKALIITCPLPQALALLETLPQLDDQRVGQLRSISYHQTVAALVTGSEELRLPGGLGALKNPNKDIAWIGDNTHKGISADGHSLTIHLTYESSSRLLETDDEIVWDFFQKALADIDGLSVADSSYQIHRWRYAEPKRVLDSKYLFLLQSPPLVLAGEAFAGPKIEGAWQSGKMAGALFL